jgi:aldehyde:ferredoxin oxidoreductase
VTPEDVRNLARETLLRERDFNNAAGLGPAFDRLPEFMAEEPLPPHGEVFDVSQEDLERVFGELSS